MQRTLGPPRVGRQVGLQGQRDVVGDGLHARAAEVGGLLRHTRTPDGRFRLDLELPR